MQKLEDDFNEFDAVKNYFVNLLTLKIDGKIINRLLKTFGILE